MSNNEYIYMHDSILVLIMLVLHGDEERKLLIKLEEASAQDGDLKPG